MEILLIIEKEKRYNLVSNELEFALHRITLNV